MKIRFIIIALLILNIKIASGQKMIEIKAGNSVIKMESFEYKNDSLVFVNLHSDEKTSIKAAKQTLPLYYGKYFGILSGGKRALSFVSNGKTLTVDPNRIYTRTGIEKTLRNYNCYSETNLKLIENLSKEFLQYFCKSKLLVAVHNNSDKEYSINSISKSNSTKKDAKEIFINPEKDEDDFYYVTEKSKFNYFKKNGYNVVLQDNINVEDDGSLSVYCGKNNISYINIECEKEHLKEQISMIEEVFKADF